MAVASTAAIRVAVRAEAARAAATVELGMAAVTVVVRLEVVRKGVRAWDEGLKVE